MKWRQELVVLVILAVVGGALFGFFIASSPTVSVQLSVSQQDATDTARSFLQERGYDVSAYRTSTVFASRSESAIFIQRQLDGSSERAALKENDIYYWETRLYRPLQQETFRVAINSRTGEVVGFEHRVPEEAPGGTLSESAAREKATAFLRAQGHELGNYELISSSTTDRQNRVDHEFVWEHTDRQVADAPYYLEVTIHGDRIGGYDPHINVPDGFTHQYQIQQNRGQLLGFTSLGLSVLLGLVAIGFGLRYYKADQFDWRFALAVGGTVTILTVVGAVNSLPSIFHSVPTTISPWQFAVITLGVTALLGLIIGGIATVMAGTGKQLSLEVLGTEPVSRIHTLVDNPDVRRDAIGQLLAGFLITGVVLGVYAVFYLVGIRLFDAWLPAQPPQVGAVALYVPALVALVVGGTAALWEEVTYRLFAIPLTKRYLRYTAIAVVLPAFIWGLGHSGYAVLPFWARAVEVTLIGIVLGVAFLRYGIVTTIAAHFSLNAFVTALPMLLATTPWLVAHGVLALLIALLPVLLAGVLYGYGRRVHDAGAR